MGVEEIGIVGDALDVVGGVGGGQDFDIDELAGGIKGETEIGGSGVAAQVIGSRRSGEVVSEKLVVGVADFVGFGVVSSAVWEGLGVVDGDRGEWAFLTQEPGDRKDHGEAVESDEERHGEMLA